MELKPCPFCMGEDIALVPSRVSWGGAEQVARVGIACGSCLALWFIDQPNVPLDEVRAAWNRRPGEAQALEAAQHDMSLHLCTPGMLPRVPGLEFAIEIIRRHIAAREQGNELS